MIPLWQARGQKGLAVLDEYLKQNDFFTAYGYSVADICVFGYTHLAEEGVFDLSVLPNLSAWIERVKSQPDYLSDYDLPDGLNHQVQSKAA